MKNQKKFILGILAIVVLLIAIYNVSSYFVADEIEAPKTISISFIDSNSQCSVDGKFSINGQAIGMTEKGSIYLSQPEYEKYSDFDNEFSLSGRTGICFGKDSNLPFVEYWENVNMADSFANGSNLTLLLKLDPRHPEFLSEVQDFIRPTEVTEYYNAKLEDYVVNSTKEDLRRITGFDMKYKSNELLFNDVNYWRTPGEVLRDRLGGDCKNWAVTALSLINNYDSSLQCYTVLWDGDPSGGHMNVFCHYDDTFAIYDQQRIISSVSLPSKTLQSMGVEKGKARIKEMLSDYYEKYGLSEENVVYALVNGSEIVAFDDTTSNESFINWAISQVNH